MKRSVLIILLLFLSSFSHAQKNGIIHFTVEVNIFFTKDLKTLALQDSEKIIQDQGVLLLPESYSHEKKSIRLIIACHGAGAGVSSSGSQLENSVYGKYLASLGYAVMDMHGAALENMGGPAALQAYLKGYQWVLDHYNIRKDGVFMMGASMGGLTSNNLVYSGTIPVIAQAAFCPVLDLYNEAWQHPWYPTTRSEIAHWYNFEGYKKMELYKGEYQKDKVSGFNPVANKTIELSGKKYKFHPVPVKIWHADKDPMVLWEISRDFIEGIKNAGGIAELRTFPAVSHEPQDLGPECGTFFYYGKEYKLKPAVEELGLWFKRFE